MALAAEVAGVELVTGYAVAGLAARLQGVEEAVVEPVLRLLPLEPGERDWPQAPEKPRPQGRDGVCRVEEPD